MPPRQPRVAAERLTAAFRKYDEYLQAGREDLLREHFDGSDGKPVWKTVTNYMKDRQSAAGKTMIVSFVEAMEELPGILEQHEERQKVAYSFIIKELGLSAESDDYVSSIADYVGNYHFYSNLKAEIRPRGSFLIRQAEKLPSMVFQFAYQMKLTHSKGSRRCDGFVFERNERVFFLGASPTSIFYGTFTARVPDEPGKALFGTIAIEEIGIQRVLFSQAALLPYKNASPAGQERTIEEWLRTPIVTV
ncbi:hypothetical protein [Bradyrhizobium sp. CCBAU 45384]|uniref:hypothetical protein n=1 Tax=Bradyrhizobium sp. CCBAU 45384 TaxID=858428 RepID=UPI00230690DC|nr:hypothetical protein [Bradyrhizobium sp. CCBAU 45384]MDA9408893.1 hypothetical protein [Bradyrhizobium sp. CCBAU 45384]